MIALYAIGLFFLSLAVIYMLFEIFDEAFQPIRNAKINLRQAWWRYRYGTDNPYEVARIRNNLVEGPDGLTRDSKGEVVIIAVYLDSWIYTLQWDKPPVLREYR